jgi:hypothetical protein
LAEVSGDLRPHQWVVIRSSGELMIPTTRASLVVGAGHAATVQPVVNDALISAHRRLLAAYVTVRDEARLLPIFGSISWPAEDESKLNKNEYLCSRLLVQLHADYHVRRQLRRISNTYLRAQMLISDVGEKTGKRRQALTELREDCELLINSTAYRTGRAASALLGLATLVPLIAIIARVPQVQFILFLRILLAVVLFGILVLPGVLALIVYNQSFQCKRRLFSSTSILENLPGASTENVYDAEDALFTLIGQPKQLERPSELWAYGVVLAALVTLIIFALITSPFNVVVGAAIAGACVLIVAIYRSGRKIRR